MIPFSPILLIYALIVFSIEGMAIGAVSGWLCSLTTKYPARLVKDALLGGLGYFAGFFGCLVVPWPANTVVEPLRGGGYVTTTMNMYQHPFRVAFVVAILLPVIFEAFRYRRTRSQIA